MNAPPYYCICGSRKYSYPPQGGLFEILKGREASKPKITKGKYKQNLEFPEGCEVQSKKNPFHSFSVHSFFDEPPLFYM